MSDNAKQDAPRATAAAEAFIAALWDKRSTVGEVHESARALVNEAFALERELAAANEAAEKLRAEVERLRNAYIKELALPECPRRDVE